jgi:hypothetical protein
MEIEMKDIPDDIIDAARTAVPALLDEVERLRAERVKTDETITSLVAALVIIREHWANGLNSEQLTAALNEIADEITAANKAMETSK